MKIAYFPKQTAYRSDPIWSSFLKSCKKLGWELCPNAWHADCAVIWSVLWYGRMVRNEKMYGHYTKNKKPVFIIEVGSLKRGITWKVSVNNITKNGIYANHDNFIPYRSEKLGLNLLEPNSDHNKPILIAGQHEKSLQWNTGMSMIDWTQYQIEEVRKYTDKPIHVRPHPRCESRHNFNQIIGKNIFLITPNILPNTYDEYDLFFDYSVIINYNSGVGLRSAWHGVPIVCDASSLASDVSMPLSSINEPYLPDRHDWFERILHTEWTKEEIEQGIPLERLLRHIDLTHTT